jgi:hypothetical protein
MEVDGSTIPGEERRDQWAEILLSNRRVVGPARHGGTVYLVLEHVEWAGIEARHNPLLLLLAAGAALLALPDWGVVRIIAVLSAIVLVLSYFLTRSTTVRIGAGQGRIEHRLPSADRQAALDFCESIVTAAHEARQGAATRAVETRAARRLGDAAQ